MKSTKIAYIGGGSRGWSRTLMKDLARDRELEGEIYLYDIDYKAAKDNEIIGNNIYKNNEYKNVWRYKAVETIKEALVGADVVMISILPGTFNEMQVDVHCPEQYGIYQSVGDTVGPGGIIRALRTIPMYKFFAEQIREYCPDAWVINFTNPMTMCVRTLYKVFPEIKAYGCCHEVFETQKLLSEIYNSIHGTNKTRDDVKIDVAGINHFTWLFKAEIDGNDLFPMYTKFVNEHMTDGYELSKGNWMNNSFSCANLVKFDLFRRYGAIAAAGDRHLAEFCNGKWYLGNKENIKRWKISLTPVSWRVKDLQERLKTTERLVKGEKLVIEDTGEESVRQIKSILGGTPITTNVNLPNKGQMKGFPLGAVVETNAVFKKDSVEPVFNSEINNSIKSMIYRIMMNQENVVEAGLTGDYELAYNAFINEPAVDLDFKQSRKLFNEMLEGTKDYLPFYDKYLNK